MSEKICKSYILKYYFIFRNTESDPGGSQIYYRFHLNQHQKLLVTIHLFKRLYAIYFHLFKDDLQK